MKARKHACFPGTLLIFSTLGWLLSVSGGQTQTLSAASLQDPFGCDGASARAVAMGKAFVAVSDDSSALFFNPAGLGNLGRIDVGVHHQSALAGITQEILSAACPVRERWGVGFTGQYLNYGAFQGREADGTPTSGLSAYQAGLGLGCGVRLAGGLFAGAAFRGVLQRFASSSYHIFNGDAGLLYAAPRGWRWGASCVNMGTSARGASASSLARFGVSKAFGGNGVYGLLAALAVSYEPRYGTGAQAGLEGSARSRYFLRAGYSYDAQEAGTEGLRGFTAGFGLALRGFLLDYAFLPFGDLGTTHRVSLGYRWGGKASAPGAQASRSSGPGLTPAADASLPRVLPSGAPAMVQPEPVTDEVDLSQGMSLSIPFDLPSSDLREGQALEGLGKWAEAVNAYQRAIRSDPRNARAWWQLANLYMRFNRRDEAIRCFEAVVRLKPEAKNLAAWLETYRAQDSIPRP